jgi:dihydroorotase-like cyclic amidohydrolase
MGGTLVIPGTGRVRAGVGVRDGTIAAIGRDDQLPAARQTMDATGRFVLPGIIDPHIHLGVRAAFEDEAASETKAALLGGVTTVGVFLREKASYLPLFERFRAAVETRSFVDVMFHATICVPGQLDEMPAYARDLGITSFKMYLCGVTGIIEHVTDDFLYAGLRGVAALGSRALMAVHAENAMLVEAGIAKVKAMTGGTLADWHQAHPDMAEEEAIQRAAYLAERAGARLYVVHLTSAMGLERLRRIRAASPHVHVETTSAYLSLDETHPMGLLLKRFPPVRAAADVEALWTGVADGTVDTIGTDNVTPTRAANQPERGIWLAKGGYGGLHTHLPVLLHEGVHRRGVSLERLVDKLTAGPARVFGIYPRKGTIAVGSDADLTLVDLNLERRVDPAESPSRGDFSPYDGMTLKGWPVATIKSGVVCVKDQRFVDERPLGRYLGRAA